MGTFNARCGCGDLWPTIPTCLCWTMADMGKRESPEETKKVEERSVNKRRDPEQDEVRREQASLAKVAAWCLLERTWTETNATGNRVGVKRPRKHRELEMLCPGYCKYLIANWMLLKCPSQNTVIDLPLSSEPLTPHSIQHPAPHVVFLQRLNVQGHFLIKQIVAYLKYSTVCWCQGYHWCERYMFSTWWHLNCPES